MWWCPLFQDRELELLRQRSPDYSHRQLVMTSLVFVSGPWARVAATAQSWLLAPTKFRRNQPGMKSGVPLPCVYASRVRLEAQTRALGSFQGCLELNAVGFLGLCSLLTLSALSIISGEGGGVEGRWWFWMWNRSHGMCFIVIYTRHICRTLYHVLAMYTLCANLSLACCMSH